MQEELVKQRIQYILENGGLVPRDDVELMLRRNRISVALAIVLQVVTIGLVLLK